MSTTGTPRFDFLRGVVGTAMVYAGQGMTVDAVVGLSTRTRRRVCDVTRRVRNASHEKSRGSEAQGVPWARRIHGCRRRIRS